MLGDGQKPAELSALQAQSHAPGGHRRLLRLRRARRQQRCEQAQVLQPGAPLGQSRFALERRAGSAAAQPADHVLSMSERLLSEVGAMLDAYDVVRRADELRKRRLEAEGLAFLSGFAELRGKLVRPVFEAERALLKSRRHGLGLHRGEVAFA